MAELSNENKQLLDIDKRMDRESLPIGLLDAYISLVRVNEQNGRPSSYKSEVGTENLDRLASRFAQELHYQVGRRQFGINGDLLMNMRTTQDHNGTCLGDIVTRHYFGTDEKGLAQMFYQTAEQRPVGYEIISKLASDLSKRYSQITDSECIQAVYKGNVQALRNGIQNLSDALDLKALKGVKVEELGEEELTKFYLQLLPTARAEQKIKQQATP